MKLLLILGLAAPVCAADLHTYCWGFLNAHPERAELPSARAEEIQAGHMAHMGKMAEAGRLLTAGPLASPGGARGLLVCQCDKVEEAVEWTRGDPAVEQKRLAMEFYRWSSYGVWGEPLASKVKADPGYKVKMVRLPFALLLRTEKMPGGRRPPEPAGKAHLDYSMKLVGEGRLRSFGLFEGAAEKLGVLIYGAMPVEEAWKLAEGDPLVREGWARPVMHVWFVAEEAVPGAR
jgi:uncharacterized protein YciI